MRAELAVQLPPGAARFATDPGHYDYAGLRCVKDLAVSELLHDEHDEDLSVQYTGVTCLSGRST